MRNQLQPPILPHSATCFVVAAALFTVARLSGRPLSGADRLDKPAAALYELIEEVKSRDAIHADEAGDISGTSLGG